MTAEVHDEGVVKFTFDHGEGDLDDADLETEISALSGWRERFRAAGVLGAIGTVEPPSGTSALA